MEIIQNNIKHKFIPSSVVSFDDIEKTESNCVFKNDVFEKYETTLFVKGEYILCNDISKLKKYSKKIKRETYEEYCEFIKKRDYEKDRWIYNIIDGISEQDKVIYRDENMIIIPSYKWDSKNIEKLHILVLPTNKELRSIRDLTIEHIELLKIMKKKTLEQITKIYNLYECDLKMFFHYDPSTYHLHIHFINVNYTDCFSSVEYSHEIHSVMDNLSMNSCYYRKVKLNVRR
jgi:m7GpppX diphosphatase